MKQITPLNSWIGDNDESVIVERTVTLTEHILPLSNTEGVELLEPCCVANSIFGTREKIDRKEVAGAIQQACQANGWVMFIADKYYLGYTRAELEKFLRSDNTSLMTYTPETFDCDDFAKVLCGRVAAVMQGIPFGILWIYRKNSQGYMIGGHAVNIFYDFETKQVALIEPQSDKMFKFNADLMKAKLIVI